MIKTGKTDESKVQSLIELGAFYFLNGKLDKAEEALIRAQELAPRNAEAYYNLGLVYEAKNNAAAARRMYGWALKLAPGHQAAKAHLDKLVGT